MPRATALFAEARRSELRLSRPTPPLSEIKKRGRWRTDASVRRYEKAAVAARPQTPGAGAGLRRARPPATEQHLPGACPGAGAARSLAEATGIEVRLKRARRRRTHQRCLLEIFSGSGRVADAWRRRGGVAGAIDLRHGQHEDVRRRSVRQDILGSIRRRLVDAVWLGTPCSSWSLARRGRAGRPGGPLRTLESLHGVPRRLAPDADRKKILEGDQTMLFSAQCIDACIAQSIPVALENPASSRLWHAAPVASLVQLSDAQSVLMDMCQHGTSYRKRTRVVTWVARWPPGWAPMCGSSAASARAQRPHELLRGAARGAREPRTAHAAAYPESFARKAATVLWL